MSINAYTEDAHGFVFWTRMRTLADSFFKRADHLKNSCDRPTTVVQQAPKPHPWAATGQRRGGQGTTNNVCLGDPRVSLCVPFIRADQGLLWGSSTMVGFKTEENENVLRIFYRGGRDIEQRIKLPPVSTLMESLQTRGVL